MSCIRIVMGNLVSEYRILKINHLEVCLIIRILSLRYIPKRLLIIVESCAPGLTSWNFVFCFFTLQKNCTLQFALRGAVGQGIAIQAKVLEKEHFNSSLSYYLLHENYFLLLNLQVPYKSGFIRLEYIHQHRGFC